MKLSVISIAYNNLLGLQKTLDVFAKHDFSSEIEIVVVDGASKDGSKAFLESQTLSKNWISESDNGIYNAMNKGISMAHGDYLWFLNSGDYAYSETAVLNLLKILDEQPDAVYAETLMVDSNGNSLGTRSEISTRHLPEELNWKSLKYGMNVSHQSFVIRREKCEKYNETIKHVSDIDWMIASLKNCKKVLKMEGILACFTMDGYSSKNRKASNKERFWVLSKHYGFWQNLINHGYIFTRKLLSNKQV